MLGEDDVAAFRTAVTAYVRAVDIADRARDEWYAAKRPIVFRQPNGATGVHPLVSAIVATSRSVMSHAGELGLTPMSAARLGRLGVRRGPGRPVGSNSAPDRVALPPIMHNDRPGVLRLAASDAAAVNRSRGHRED
jgi:terminase small subunit-like protein